MDGHISSTGDTLKQKETIDDQHHKHLTSVASIRTIRKVGTAATGPNRCPAAAGLAAVCPEHMPLTARRLHIVGVISPPTNPLNTSRR